MSYTVIPKSITTFQTGRNKPLDIYVWAYIKLCSNFSTGISDITQKRLSELTNTPEETIGNSIKRLKDKGYLEVRSRTVEGFKKRNSYHFKTSEQNFALIDNEFFHKGYNPNRAGFMLLMRSICLNNTNEVLWPIVKIAEEIGIGRNTVSTLLKECEKLGLIKTIPKGYEITEDCLKWDAVHNKANSPIYKAICDFCESQGINPPIWNKDAMSVLESRYHAIDLLPYDEFNICFQLNNSCKQLPKKVSLPYFVKALKLDSEYRAWKQAKSAKIKKEYPL